MTNEDNKIPYRKAPTTLEEQVAKLKLRGLIVDDEKLAKEYLSNISYYRLSAYTYQFKHYQNPDDDFRIFKKDIHFQDIIDLYCFDRRLRFLLFNAIEKIEVAIRSKITQIYCDSTKDSHWFEDETLFRDDSYYDSIENEEIFIYNVLSDDIEKEVKRSNEDFIKHYYYKYSSPLLPPAWMTLETVTLSTLSRLYKLLNKDKNKEAVANEFGLTNCLIFENWLHGIANLRNCCAHHSRIWNRRFIVNILLPYKTVNPFIGRDHIKAIRNNKLFPLLCCIMYILKIISPESDFKLNLVNLIKNAGKLVSIKDMGFPERWEFLDVWKD